MDFVNESGFPADLARAGLFYRDLMLATVVVKAAFEVGPDGGVARVDDQLPVSEADVQTDLGSIDGDVVPVKPGCDFAVLGRAHAPSPDRPVDRLEIDLRAGSFSRRLLVFGDRTWTASGNGFRPSPPQPFTVQPITYAHAFGGVAVHTGKLKGPYGPNGRGKGYVLLKEHVAGTPLPNVEEADQLLSSWDETPMPAGLAPLPRDSSLRMNEGFAVDLEAQTTQLGPAAFSFSHPRMRLPSYPGGEEVVLKGMRPGLDWKFTLPPLAFHAQVTLGDARYALPLDVDTLCLFPDHGRFYAVARRCFVYQLLPRRTRRIRLATGQAPPGLATTTVKAEQASASPLVRIEPPMARGDLPLPFDLFIGLYPLTRIVEQLPLCPSG